MMNGKKLFLPCVLIVMISMAVCMTGCAHTSNTDSRENVPNTGSIEVMPTGEADPALKNTVWAAIDGKDLALSFREKRNTVWMGGLGEVAYSKEGEKITFDLSALITIYNAITVDEYIVVQKTEVKEGIALLEKMIEAGGDAEKKKELEEGLQQLKSLLPMLENPDSEMREVFKKLFPLVKKMPTALEPYKTFEGTFNGNELTVERFPAYDAQSNTVTPTKVIYKKR